MRSQHRRILSALLAGSALALAQNPEVAAETPNKTTAQRIVTALRVFNPITIDGVLREEEYRAAPATDFLQNQPDEGKPARQKTDVWVSFDDAALYIGGRLYDSAPDSIVSKLGRRDAFLNADFFYVGIDAYNDKRSGFFFMTFPSGTIVDGTMYNDSWDDNSWDGVWESAATIDNEGWSVEMRIPYSQLRFPKQDEHVWGINFVRRIERYKEESHWSLVKRGSGIWVSGFGELHGIKNITPPERIEVLPYIAGGSEALLDEPGNPFRKKVDFFGNVGADVKVGLGSNLTVNATINPDFGQVEVDPAVVNLTQFETFFDEKRPFFIEGSDYFQFGSGGANNTWGFNFGNPGFVYSRRIGRSPRGSVQHSGFSDVPRNTTILGAAKVTGKLFDNITFGTMHALTENEHARVDDNGTRYNDVVEPFSYYGVARALKEFDNGRHAIGGIATASIHKLNEPYLLGTFNRRSWSGGIDGWVHLDSAKVWVLTGWLAGSLNEGDPARMIALQRAPLRYYQRPDQNYVKVDSSATSLAGYMMRYALNKQSGNFRMNAAFGIASPGFEVNDLGFQFFADRINGHVVLGYNWYEPDGFFRQKGFNLATARSYDFGGRRTHEVFGLFSNAQFMNYWEASMKCFFNPQYVDIRNTRGGPAMLTTNAYALFLEGNTNEGNEVSFDLELGGGRSESGGYQFEVSPGIEWRPASGLYLRFSPALVRNVTIAQFVTNIEDATATHTYGTRHVFGRLDQQELSAVMRMNWTFTPRLSLQVFIQPLISVGTYDQFKELKQPLTYTFNRYGEGGSSIQRSVDADGNTVYDVTTSANTQFSFSNPDFNYKSFRGNAVLRWEYLPGSTLFFAWTHGRQDFRDPGDFGFGRDLGNLFRNEPENVFLLKIAYWLTPQTL
jgi:hypothetical protein